MSKHQRTFFVSHEGHTAAPQDYSTELHRVLTKDDLLPYKDVEIIASTETSGVGTKFTVTFESEKSNGRKD